MFKKIVDIDAELAKASPSTNTIVNIRPLSQTAITSSIARITTNATVPIKISLAVQFVMLSMQHTTGKLQRQRDKFVRNCQTTKPIMASKTLRNFNFRPTCCSLHLSVLQVPNYRNQNIVAVDCVFSLPVVAQFAVR